MSKAGYVDFHKDLELGQTKLDVSVEVLVRRQRTVQDGMRSFLGLK